MFPGVRGVTDVGRTIVTFGMKIPAGIFIPTMVCFQGVKEVDCLGCWGAVWTTCWSCCSVSDVQIPRQYILLCLSWRAIAIRVCYSRNLRDGRRCRCARGRDKNDCLSRRHKYIVPYAKTNNSV